MPKKQIRVRRQNVSRSLSDQNQITRLSGRVTATVAISNTAGATTFSEINLAIANLGARVVNIADAFMYWRMVKLRYYQVVRAGTAASDSATFPGSSILHACSFTPLSNANFAVVASTAQMADFAEYKQGNGYHGIGFSVGRSGLIGSQMTKWLATNTTSDTDMQSAGTISIFSSQNVVTTAAGSVFSVVEFELEFKSPTDPATVPLSSRSRMVRSDEKDQYFDVKPEVREPAPVSRPPSPRRNVSAPLGRGPLR